MFYSAALLVNYGQIANEVVAFLRSLQLSRHSDVVSIQPAYTFIYVTRFASGNGSHCRKQCGLKGECKSDRLAASEWRGGGKERGKRGGLTRAEIREGEKNSG